MKNKKVIETGKTVDYTYMDKATRGHRCMVPLTPRVVWGRGIWWHGLVLGFIGELSKGHGAVIWRSQQDQICAKRLQIAFFLFLLTLCSLEMYTMAWNIPRSQHGPTQKHPWEVAEITFRAGGFFTRLPPPPSNYPCVNTVSHGTMYKITHLCYILTNNQYIYYIW